MLNIHDSHDLQGFINGETKPPPQLIPNDEFKSQQNPLFVKGHSSNRLVKGWLTTTLSEEVLGIVVGHNSTVKV